MKLLAPRRGPTACIFTSTYGGGLLAGDAICLSIACGPGTTGLLRTQASTKVYRSTADQPSRQILDADIGEGATLVVLPDPITPYAAANYVQQQSFHLAAGASLVVLDWMTSGRAARAEHWAFDRYVSRNHISVGGRCIFRDALCLENREAPETANPNSASTELAARRSARISEVKIRNPKSALSSSWRMGRFECYATAVIVGPCFSSGVSEVLSFIAGQPVERRANMIFSASALPGGAVVRVAATQSEQVGRWLRQRLGFISALLGDDPWSRHW